MSESYLCHFFIHHVIICKPQLTFLLSYFFLSNAKADGIYLRCVYRDGDYEDLMLEEVTAHAFDEKEDADSPTDEGRSHTHRLALSRVPPDAPASRSSRSSSRNPASRSSRSSSRNHRSTGLARSGNDGGDTSSRRSASSAAAGGGQGGVSSLVPTTNEQRQLNDQDSDASASTKDGDDDDYEDDGSKKQKKSSSKSNKKKSSKSNKKKSTKTDDNDKNGSGEDDTTTCACPKYTSKYAVTHKTDKEIEAQTKKLHAAREEALTLSVLTSEREKALFLEIWSKDIAQHLHDLGSVWNNENDLREVGGMLPLFQQLLHIALQFDDPNIDIPFLFILLLKCGVGVNDGESYHFMGLLTEEERAVLLDTPTGWAVDVFSKVLPKLKDGLNYGNEMECVVAEIRLHCRRVLTKDGKQISNCMVFVHRYNQPLRWYEFLELMDESIDDVGCFSLHSMVDGLVLFGFIIGIIWLVDGVFLCLLCL